MPSQQVNRSWDRNPVASSMDKLSGLFPLHATQIRTWKDGPLLQTFGRSYTIKKRNGLPFVACVRWETRWPPPQVINGLNISLVRDLPCRPCG